MGIRYQNMQGGWETEIEVTSLEGENVTWLVYFTVENNDYRLATNKYISGVRTFTPSYSKDRSQLSIEARTMIGSNQTMRLVSTKTNIADG